LQGRKESGTAAAAVRFKKGLCGLKAKDLPGIPWRVAFALQDDGWWLRQDIIWHKPNPKPESVTDRCTATHEYIFMLTKSARYYYDQDAIREPSVSAQPKHEVAGWASGPGSHASIDHAKVKVASAAAFGGPNGAMRRKYVPGCSQPTTRPAKGVAEVCSTRNCRSVWTIASQPCKESHFATFPEELPRRCIMASTREGDMVLDPFAGSGTTLMVAKELGRNYIGIELNPEYAAMAERRVASVTGSLFAQK
jgi:DNA modification methylase